MQSPAVHPPSDTDPAPEASAHRPGGSPAAARPVFLDPSGRRQRRVRRFGRLLVIPAAGYVALLLSAVFGGPSVNSPYLPLPVAGDHGSGTATSGPTAPGRTSSAGSKGAAHGSGTPTARATAAPAPASRLSPSPSAPRTATASASASAAPTVKHGKSPVTHPVPTHSNHGHG